MAVLILDFLILIINYKYNNTVYSPLLLILKSKTMNIYIPYLLQLKK